MKSLHGRWGLTLEELPSVEVVTEKGKTEELLVVSQRDTYE